MAQNSTERKISSPAEFKDFLDGLAAKSPAGKGYQPIADLPLVRVSENGKKDVYYLLWRKDEEFALVSLATLNQVANGDKALEKAATKKFLSIVGVDQGAVHVDQTVTRETLKAANVAEVKHFMALQVEEAIRRQVEANGGAARQKPPENVPVSAPPAPLGERFNRGASGSGQDVAPVQQQQQRSRAGVTPQQPAEPESLESMAIMPKKLAKGDDPYSTQIFNASHAMNASSAIYDKRIDKNAANKVISAFEAAGLQEFATALRTQLNAKDPHQAFQIANDTINKANATAIAKIEADDAKGRRVDGAQQYKEAMEKATDPKLQREAYEKAAEALRKAGIEPPPQPKDLPKIK